MSDEQQNQSVSLGVYDRPDRTVGMTTIELVALGATIVWLVGSAIFFFAIPNDQETSSGGLRFIVVLLCVFLPIAIIWIGAAATRSLKVMREESARLQAAVDGIRQTYIAQQQANVAVKPSMEQKLNEIVAAQKQTETALATFSSRRDHPADVSQASAAQGDEQPALALGTPAEHLTPPLSVEDVIRALHFPETAEDAAGFASLRRALKDRRMAQVVQAAQDILTLMSQDGIYMDDLTPDRARPEIWRKFAAGERGRTIAPLGGVRDRSSLALTAGRMRQDTIFRDSAHHFLRLFDQTFMHFEKSATDSEIVALAETRTARAFMLLGRVTGMFD